MIHSSASCQPHTQLSVLMAVNAADTELNLHRKKNVFPTYCVQRSNSEDDVKDRQIQDWETCETEIDKKAFEMVPAMLTELSTHQ